MAAPGDRGPPSPPNRARRGGPAASEHSRVCPACRSLGPRRLAPGQVCAACEAHEAWTAMGDAPLVIDAAAIADASRRRRGEAGEPIWRRAFAWSGAAIALALAVLAALGSVRAVAARPIAPLRTVLDDLQTAAAWCLVTGAAALLVGIVVFVRVRRRRVHRRLVAVASPLIAVIAGTVAVLVGWLGEASYGRGLGWRFNEMPPREGLGLAAHLERIVDATVAVLAPDADGDARALTTGAGAIVATDAARAWIVTCSHVAMPYAAVGAWRRARDAQPVWVQLSDGREGRAVVRWVAPPPLDVALVELPIERPPPPVPIAAGTGALQPSTRVAFVPHPFRAGWKVVRGELVRRELHRTPAGAYDLLFSDLPVTHGDSGSGLYDESGQLVGINTWTSRVTGAAEGISLPSEALRAVVDAIQAGTLDALALDAAPPGAEKED